MNRAAYTTQDERIEILDPSLRAGFTQLPRPVLRAKGLSRNAKTLYALLLDYAWQDGSCFPGQHRLATDLDISTDTLKRDLDELRRYGLITWRQRGMTKTNVYYILPLDECPKLDLSARERLATPQVADSADLRNQEPADLRKQEAVDLRHHDSADSRQPDSAPLPSQEAADSPGQEAASLRHNVYPARPESDSLNPDDKKQHTKRSRASAKVGVLSGAGLDSGKRDNPQQAELASRGISPQVAAKLCRSHPAEAVQQQLDVLAWVERWQPGTVRDPARWLRSAIEQGWPPPKGYQSPADFAAEQQARADNYSRVQRNQQASIFDVSPPAEAVGVGLVHPDPATAATLPADRPATDNPQWDMVIVKLTPQLAATKLTLLQTASLRPYDGSGLAELAFPNPAARSQFATADLAQIEAALTEVLGQHVYVTLTIID